MVCSWLIWFKLNSKTPKLWEGGCWYLQNLQIFQSWQIKIVLTVGHLVIWLAIHVQYTKFFDQIDPYFQPKELTFTDVMTGDIGHISVDKIEYNIGLPSFLFDISDETD